MNERLTFNQLKRLVRESADSDGSVTISWDAYEEALDDRRAIDETNGLKIDDDVWELAIDYLRETGVPDDPSPSNIVDNLAVNSEVVYEESWEDEYPDMHERYNGDWNEFVSNEAITSTQLAVNDNVAILNFGW